MAKKSTSKDLETQELHKDAKDFLFSSGSALRTIMERKVHEYQGDQVWMHRYVFQVAMLTAITAQGLFVSSGKAQEMAVEDFHAALLDIVSQAFADDDLHAAALAVYQAMVGYLGPDKVPSNLDKHLVTAWREIQFQADGISDSQPRLTHGDPSAWIPGLRDPDPLNPTSVPALDQAPEAPVPAIPEVSDARLMQLEADAQAVRAADIAVMDAFPVMEAIGRIKAAQFYSTVGDSIVAQAFLEIKNAKKYKGIPYKDKSGNLRHVEDLDEFCREFLGKSYTRCAELAKNLHVLGPDLYERAEAIGFRARDYAALKALPESEQAVVKEALAAESKDQVLGLLQDLAERHASERTALKKQAADLKADLDARDKLLKAKTERGDKLAIQLEKLKSLPPDETWRLRLAKEEEAVAALALDYTRAEAAANAFIARSADIIAAEDVSQHTRDHVFNTLRYFAETLASFLLGHGIDVRFEDIIMPSWIKDQAATDLGGQPEEAE